MYLPKLLIPSVIDAEPDKYLFNRALALWTSINFQYFAKLKGNPDVEFKNREQIAHVLGDINYKYARDLHGKDLATLDLF